MCRRTALVIAALLLAPWVATGAGAQSVGTPLLSDGERTRLEEMRIRAQQRIEALEPLRDAAVRRERERGTRAAVAAADGVTALDTLFVGPFTLIARKSQSGELRRLVRDIYPWYADLLAGIPRFERIFTYEIGPAATGLGVTGDRSEIWLKEFSTPEERATDVQRVIQSQLVDVVPDAMRDWMGLRGPAPTDAQEWGYLYRDLVTAASQSASLCLKGEAESCWVTLQLLPGLEAREEVWKSARARRLWYSDDQIRARAQGWIAENPEMQYPTRADCKGGSVSACEAILEKSSWLGPPVRDGAHLTMASFALERGGEGSFARLQNTEGSIRSRLAAAAQMSETELAEAWSAKIRAARPVVHADLDRAALVVFLVFVLLGVMARSSTRWRFP